MSEIKEGPPAPKKVEREEKPRVFSDHQEAAKAIARFSLSPTPDAYLLANDESLMPEDLAKEMEVADPTFSVELKTNFGTITVSPSEEPPKKLEKAPRARQVSAIVNAEAKLQAAKDNLDLKPKLRDKIDAYLDTLGKGLGTLLKGKAKKAALLTTALALASACAPLRPALERIDRVIIPEQWAARAEAQRNFPKTEDGKAFLLTISQLNKNKEVFEEATVQITGYPEYEGETTSLVLVPAIGFQGKPTQRLVEKRYEVYKLHATQDPNSEYAYVVNIESGNPFVMLPVVRAPEGEPLGKKAVVITGRYTSAEFRKDEGGWEEKDFVVIEKVEEAGPTGTSPQSP